MSKRSIGDMIKDVMGSDLSSSQAKSAADQSVPDIPTKKTKLPDWNMADFDDQCKQVFGDAVSNSDAVIPRNPKDAKP